MAKWNASNLLQVKMPALLLTMLNENRLLHAINIEGSSGSGRTKLAYAIAGAILCQAHSGKMCGHCIACQKVIAGVHSDILELSAADGAYKKDAIRTMRSEIYKSPSEGCAKVIILKDAQDLTAEVQNLLLKVIEEPPPDTFFIFTTTNRYMLLGTILSRIVTVTMPLPTEDQSIQWLQSAVPEKSLQECKRALVLANNCPEKALQIMVDESTKAHYDLVERVLVAVVNEERYTFLSGMVPAEKNRQEYLQTLTTLKALLNSSVACEYKFSTKKLIRLKTVLDTAIRRCESNGYLQLISAAMLEEALEKKG